jgi:hypothetical protein
MEQTDPIRECPATADYRSGATGVSAPPAAGIWGRTFGHISRKRCRLDLRSPRAGGDPDARSEFHGFDIDATDSVDQHQPRPDRPLGVVPMGARIAEISRLHPSAPIVGMQNPIGPFAGNLAKPCREITVMRSLSPPNPMARHRGSTSIPTLTSAALLTVASTFRRGRFLRVGSSASRV